ncbi:GNAT family N-acetyltransferase [Bacillus sp. BRMEA1]|uniref:GNAT family N-acetyltransferase n=1 Tax=Neobacillus endophyticus TaxID=2738405 RepID=UPI00156760EC|nr:GNAT family N-acetyltransferase [Neobacillus endophyticus]NRD80050.1 GNAT family N-acetyltransferase [Neobacillus endophyticus]
MLNIELRRPKQDDTFELWSFFNRVIQDTFHEEGISEMQDQIKNEIESKKQLLQCDFDSNGETHFFWLAIDKTNHKIIGTIEYGPVSDLIINASNGQLKDCVEIGTVFVDVAYQKQGVGTLLWNVMYITLQSKGMKEFCLDSGYSNAQKIWTKKFGKPDYVLEDYWGNGYHHMIWKRRTDEAAIIMKIH